jgi:hypothetical protein
MTTVKGNFFVVPNKAFRLDDCTTTTQRSIRAALSNIKETATAEEYLVQVWYVNQACDNWGSHKWDKHPEFFGSYGIPQFVPLRLLEGIREGETLIFEWVDGPTIQLKAAQLEYRYPFGRFEDVLESVK